MLKPIDEYIMSDKNPTPVQISTNSRSTNTEIQSALEVPLELKSGRLYAPAGITSVVLNLIYDSSVVLDLIGFTALVLDLI